VDYSSLASRMGGKIRRGSKTIVCIIMLMLVYFSISIIGVEGKMKAQWYKVVALYYTF